METTTTRARMLYEPTAKILALPTTVELPTDEHYREIARQSKSRKPWGLRKRDDALRALRDVRDYRIGLHQGCVDAARGTGYSEERFSPAYNLGYHEGYATYASHRNGWQPWQREEFDRLYLAD